MSNEASPGERFYKYLPELARRDRENLLANQIITKDIDIERGGFEAEKPGMPIIDIDRLN